tara:strand:+ start:933 stop:1265 length:333 start_codon:yes stop_codon:yes gene_type:complete
MFSKQIDDLFFNAQHAGDGSGLSSVKVARSGDASRAAVILFLGDQQQTPRAQFLATGGVALIACCEYWARQVESGVAMDPDVDQWMRTLKIDSIWRCDVALVVSAALSLL